MGFSVAILDGRFPETSGPCPKKNIANTLHNKVRTTQSFFFGFWDFCFWYFGGGFIHFQEFGFEKGRLSLLFLHVLFVGKKHGKKGLGVNSRVFQRNDSCKTVFVRNAQIRVCRMCQPVKVAIMQTGAHWTMGPQPLWPKFCPLFASMKCNETHPTKQGFFFPGEPSEKKGKTIKKKEFLAKEESKKGCPKNNKKKIRIWLFSRARQVHPDVFNMTSIYWFSDLTN